MPQISILLSALNAERWLSQALDSLEAQTFIDWECLMTDDGSTDATRSLMESYRSSDKRFSLLTHESPRGLTASLIESAHAAQGFFLGRQDADDWSEPDRLERQMELFATNPRLHAVGSHFALHDQDGLYLDTVESACYPWTARRLLRRRNSFAHGSLIFRRSAYDRVGGYRAAFRYAQDYDLLLRLSDMGDLSAVDAALYHHRFSHSGIGRSKRLQQAAYAQLARDCAERRKSGISEDLLLSQFREPAVGMVEEILVDPILLHLVKSGQRDSARRRLAGWFPQTARGRMMKRGLSFLNNLPSFVCRGIYHAHRFTQLF